MASTCDVKIQVNGEHTFCLDSTRLYRSGYLTKLIRKALGDLDSASETDDSADTAADSRSRSSSGDMVSICLENVPGGADAFELAVRFCYTQGDLVITSANVARLRCVAELLDMTEDYGNANLLRRTESFLKNVIFWSWHESLTVLRSCEELLSYPESAQLIHRCVQSLAKKIDPTAAGGAAAGPGNTSPTGSHRSACEPHRPSVASDSSLCSKNSCSTTTTGTGGRRFWWFQDLCSLSIYLVEKFFRALLTSHMDHRVLSRFLLHYARKVLPVLGYHSVSPPLIAFSGSLCPSPKRKPCEEALHPVQVVYSHTVQCDILEIVVSLLACLEAGASSCRTLFGLLRVAHVLEASDACRMQLEQKIGSQLDTATVDSLLVPTPSRTCAPLYDVDLVLRLVDYFLRDRENLLESPVLGAAVHKKHDSGFLAWLFDSHRDHSRVSDECSGPFGVQKSLAAVGDLLDKYLTEIAADVYLKPSKFEALAGALPDFARCCHDALYRAVDIYLEAHPNVTEAEAASICGVLNFQKLSMEACQHLTKNRTFPPFVSLQVLLAQQMQLRAAVQGCYTKRKKRSASRSHHSGGLVGKMFDSGNILTAPLDAECPPPEVVRQENDDLKVNLRAMQSKVEELEKLCKRMRLEMAKHAKARRRLLC